MVYVDDGRYKFLYSSDVEGCMYRDPLEYILSKKPNLLLLDGPPTYLDYDPEALKTSFESIRRIASMDNLETIVLDHHFTRDRGYMEWLDREVKPYLKGDINLITIAEYMGVRPRFLEAYRDLLYQGVEI